MKGKSKAVPVLNLSRDSSDGVTTGYGLEGRGFDSRQGQETFRRSVHTALGPRQSPIQWIPGALLSGDKAAGA
jgi:hypothetical protein